MLRTHNQITLSDNFFASTLQGDNLNTLTDKYHYQLRRCPQQIVTVEDTKRVRALYDAMVEGRETCTFDAYSFVYYWLYSNRFDFQTPEQCLDAMFTYVVNNNLMGLFLNNDHYFDMQMVANVFYEMAELFSTNEQSV